MTDLWAAVAHRLRPELMWAVGTWQAERLPDGLRMKSPDCVYVYRVPGVDLDEFMSKLPKVDRGAGILHPTDLNNSDTKIHKDSAPASVGADPGGGAAAHSALPPGDPHAQADARRPEPSRSASRGRTRVLYPYDRETRGWEPARLPRGLGGE